MAVVSLAPVAIQQFFNNLGLPNAGGTLLTQVASVNYPTYQDSAGTIPLPNPIPLNSRGEISNAAGVSCQLFLVQGVTYTFTLFDALGNQLDTAPYVVSIPASAASLAFTPPGLGAVTTTVGAKIQQIVSVFDFYTAAQIADVQAGTATLDTATAIAATYNATPGGAGVIGNGGNVFYPQGTHLVTGAVNIQRHNMTSWGCGRGTIIMTNSATADVFLMGDGVNTFAGNQFIDMRVESTVTKSAGYAWNCQFQTNIKFYRCWAGTLDSYVANGSVARLFNGVYFNKFTEAVWEGGEITCSNNGMVIQGNLAGTFGAELSVGGGLRMAYATGKGIWIGGGAGGVHLGRIDISFCGYGVYIDDTLTPTTANREIFLDAGCTIDSNTNWGINMESNACSLFQMSAGAWCAGNGTGGAGRGGMRVAPTTGVTPELHIIGSKFYSNNYDNLQLSVGNLTLTGCVIRNAGGGLAGGGHGLLIAGPAVTPAQVIGNYFHNNGNATRGRDISITSGAQDNFLFEGNVFQTWGEIATSPAINNPAGLGPTKIISNNIGYVTENSGTGNILNGAATVVINHGLAGTPGSVSAWFASNPVANAQLFIAPSNFTATQFTVNSTQLAGAPGMAVGWRASLGTQ